MAVVCTLFIHELNVGTYLKNNRQFKLDDQIRICYQFSRELEHSDLNLNRFEELMSEKEIFSFENLLMHTFPVLSVSSDTSGSQMNIYAL